MDTRTIIKMDCAVSLAQIEQIKKALSNVLNVDLSINFKYRETDDKLTIECFSR